MAGWMAVVVMVLAEACCAGSLRGTDLLLKWREAVRACGTAISLAVFLGKVVAGAPSIVQFIFICQTLDDICLSCERSPKCRVGEPRTYVTAR